MEQSIENFEGTKVVTINEGGNGMGDVQAGIEFIYHMREHLIDIGVATIYGLVVYAAILYIKRRIDNL